MRCRSKSEVLTEGEPEHKESEIELAYQCYPVWLYDEEGLAGSCALPSGLSGDHGLDERFRSIQERFDATCVDTPTEFRHIGFAIQEEEAAFASDPNAAIAEFIEKCPKWYSLEVSTGLTRSSQITRLRAAPGCRANEEHIELISY
jgi:hypothetical protein